MLEPCVLCSIEAVHALTVCPFMNSGSNGRQGRANTSDSHGEEDAALRRVASLPTFQIPHTGIYECFPGGGKPPFARSAGAIYFNHIAFF
jgi:hypothetical protein